MDSQLKLENLPTEIIFKILEYLPFSDLSKVTELSRQFYDIGTDPLLWKQFDVTKHHQTEKLISTLILERFQRLETLHLSPGHRGNRKLRLHHLIPEVDLSKHQLETIFNCLENIELKQLTLQHMDLTSLSPALLARALNRIENVAFNHDVKIDDGQLCEVLDQLSKKTRMKALQIEEIDLRNIKSASLSLAVNNLERFNSYYCDFSLEQLRMIFDQMAMKTKLRDLSFFNKDSLEEVDAEVIAKALNNLERLYVGNSRLSATQLVYFFEQMSKETKLTKINLVFKDSYPFGLAAIPSAILARGVNRLEEVVMPFLHVSQIQMKDILERIAANSKIKHIDLGINTIPDVGLEVLKQIMFKIEPNEFKFHLQGKILEIYEATILSLKQELVDKEAKQVTLRTQQQKHEGKAFRARLVDALRKNEKLTSFFLNSKFSKNKRLIQFHSGNFQVSLCRRSKFSSAYRFSARSRVSKKSKVFFKMKISSNNHICELK